MKLCAKEKEVLGLGEVAWQCLEILEFRFFLNFTQMSTAKKSTTLKDVVTRDYTIHMNKALHRT